jgi:tRNA/tmRNA/rRNA uracil-C5-methylase (TrmA/RlmC/RlmD family)
MPVTDFFIVSGQVPMIAEEFRLFALASGLPAFDREHRLGTLGSIFIRTTEIGDLTLVVCTYGRITDDTAEKLRQAFEKKVTSRFYAETTSLRLWYRNLVLNDLSGHDYIVQRLLGLNIVISPVSFFEMDLTCAEVLFAHVAEWAAVDDQTVLINCYCRTGMAAFLMARRTQHVFGIDFHPSAISDATRSSQWHQITNAIFILGKVEDELAPLLFQ